MKARYIFRWLAVSVLLLVVAFLYPPIHNWLSDGHQAITVLLGLLPVALLLWLYFSLIRPFDTLSNGMDLLAAQDFASRLSPVGQIDADQLVKMFNEMMQRLKSERMSLQEKNHFLHLLIESSPPGIAILDFDNKISETNPAMRRLLGFSGHDWELKGLSFDDLAKGSELARCVASLKGVGSETFRLSDTDIVRCSRMTFVDSGFPRPFIIVEPLTEEVVAAEKAAYGKVIRIIAHEVNNTLAGVTSVLGTIADIMRGDPAESEVVTTVDSCVDRCRSLGSFISSYSSVVKIPEPTLARVNLGAAIESLRPFLESMLPANITLTCRIASENAEVMADTVLLEQVIVNIVKNSIESIGSQPDSLITIAVESSKRTAQLTITDDGPGISPEAHGKLFSPFFSTKPGGRGLGLMFVAEILRRHQATFSLTTAESDDSAQRPATKFVIAFPRN